MCKVSYIVPVYNAQDTLLRCVESLVYAARQDFEIILSEDCSSDQSWDTCLQLQQQFPNIVCIRNEKNSGVSHTRNAALEVATGEYILFVDSDDWVSSEYTQTLLQYAQQYPKHFIVCGFHFVDYVLGVKHDYVWDESGEADHLLERRDLFELTDKILIQQLWNKVFRKDIIDKAHIRFDVKQTMGEDFEFVLDYLKAADFQKCTVINKPLYSYIRANQNSLMSKFGVEENSNGFRRMDVLLTVCGETDPIAQEAHQKAKTALLQNYAYQIVHANNLSVDKKKELLIALLGEDEAKTCYKQQTYQLKKEQLAGILKKARGFKDRLANKLQRTKNQKIIRQVKDKLRNSDVTLISQNCIGGVFYHDMGMEFLSPTINLFFKAADFVKFVKGLDHYLACEPDMRWGLEYPIGRLDDIDVYFMHYNTCEEAKAAWERRKKRINRDKIVVLSTDMEGFDEAVFEQWKTIPFPKVLFTANPAFANEPGTVFYPEYQSLGCVPDLIPKREFYKEQILVDVVKKGEA